MKITMLESCMLGNGHVQFGGGESEKYRPRQLVGFLSHIETCFNVQRRMADFHFARATSWEEAKQVHAHWVASYNFQPHYAHRLREDHRHSPAEVLDWVHGMWRSAEELHRIFYATRFARRLDRAGYGRFRHWRVYGEGGLAKRAATLWLYHETLTVEFANTPLSQFTVAYQPDKKHFRQVAEPRIYATQYQSPQLLLWDAGAVEWFPIRHLPDYAPRRTRPRAAAPVQQSLFA